MIASWFHVIRVLVVPLTGVAVSVGTIAVVVFLVAQVQDQILGDSNDTLVPTATPRPTPTQRVVVGARDSLTFVTSEEPATIGAASAYCGDNIRHSICNDLASDPLTWIDDQQDFQVVGLTGVESWEQLDPNRWRFKLRDGITFHNGAPWNAEQAKFWIDYFGDEETSGHNNSNDFSFHGVIGGEVMDNLTLDVVCGQACPILPRTTIFTKFQDVPWFQRASEHEIERMTIGLGPYRIVEWRPGREIELEAFEDYNPNPATTFAQAPTIKRVFQFWRNDPFVRASMVATGEADWAEISLDDRGSVPKWKTGANNEVYLLAIDTVHHPELRKAQVRQALNLAIDCQALMEEIHDNLMSCYGNMAQAGAVGITPENSAPYPYDPELAQQLLFQANYNPDNVITLHVRDERMIRNVEYAEAAVTFWREVGINAELLVMESRDWSAVYLSNCGSQRSLEDFANAPGRDLEEKCRNLGPGPPNFASMQLTGVATSTESLDYSRQAKLRNSCFSRSSGVCEDELEKMIERAVAMPTGPLRTQRMEEIADHVHEHFHVVQGFQVVAGYALAEHLEWEPYYAPRLRANTMFFTR